MIITLEHEDIETALLSWMNEKGMAANKNTTSIDWTKSRKTGRITAVVNPNGIKGDATDSPDETPNPAPPNNLFGGSNDSDDGEAQAG